MGYEYKRRTMKLYRERGYEVEDAESRIPVPGRNVTRDSFGLVDFWAAGEGEFVGVQATGQHGHAAHLREMLANPRLPALLRAGVRVVLVSWRRLLVRRGGRRRRWTPRETDVGIQYELERLLA